MKGQLGLIQAVVLLFVISSLAGCTTPEERATTIQKGSIARMHTIVIQQMKFTPATLTLNEGDTVTWINRDIVVHNVTEETNKEWASPNLETAKSWSMVVSKSSSYFCTIHPVMKGTLNTR